MTPSLRDWLYLIGLGAIWGGAFMGTKIATADVPPLTIAAVRLGLGAATMLALLALRGEGLPGPSAPHARSFWLHALGVGIASNALPFSLLAWAQGHIPSGLAGVFMAMVPLFILPLAHAFVPGERLSWRKAAGFTLGFAGILVLIGPDVLAGLGTGGGLALLAQLACLLVALNYATGSIISKRAPDLGLIRFAAAALLIAAVLTVPLALVVERPDPAGWSAGSHAALLYLGLLPTALATLMLLSVIASAGPGFLGLVNYQVPVWAVAFGIVFLGEDPSPRLWLALLLILAGLAVAQNLVGLRRGGHARG